MIHTKKFLIRDKVKVTCDQSIFRGERWMKIRRVHKSFVPLTFPFRSRGIRLLSLMMLAPRIQRTSEEATNSWKLLERREGRQSDGEDWAREEEGAKEKYFSDKHREDLLEREGRREGRVLTDGTRQCSSRSQGWVHWVRRRRRSHWRAPSPCVAPTSLRWPPVSASHRKASL